MMWSKTTEYAIRALIMVAAGNLEGRRPGFREVAEAIDAPVQFTAKVLQTMSRTGLVRSVRGKGGGFFFDPHGEDLTLAAVIRVLEGDGYFTGCLVGLPKCDKEHPCPLHDEFTRIRSDLVRMAEQETIQALAKKTLEGEGRLKRG